jgi:hypothetical protein
MCTFPGLLQVLIVLGCWEQIIEYTGYINNNKRYVYIFKKHKIIEFDVPA